jgi:hypothetical protein
MSLGMAEGRDFGRECISHLAHSGPNLLSLHEEHFLQIPFIHRILHYKLLFLGKEEEGQHRLVRVGRA